MVKTSTLQFSLHTIGSKIPEAATLENLSEDFEASYTNVFDTLNSLSFDAQQSTVDAILKYAAEV